MNDIAVTLAGWLRNYQELYRARTRIDHFMDGSRWHFDSSLGGHEVLDAFNLDGQLAT